MYVLNEKRFIEKRLKDDNLYKESITTLLVRYYIEKGMSKKEIIENVSNYYKKRIKSYKELSNKLVISGIVERELKNKTPLINMTHVPVSSSEYGTIKQLNNKTEERVLFSFLVLAKYLNIINLKNDNWTTKDTGKLFKSIAKVNMNQVDQYLLLKKFKDMGLVEFAKGINTNIRITFIDNKDELIKVDSFVDLGKFYTDIGKNKLVRCQECDKLVKRESNSMKYCKPCYEKIHQELDRKYQERKYKSK